MRRKNRSKASHSGRKDYNMKEHGNIQVQHRYEKITAASRISGISYYHIRQGIKDGTVPYKKIGKIYFIDMEQWLSMLRSSCIENLNEEVRGAVRKALSQDGPSSNESKAVS